MASIFNLTPISSSFSHHFHFRPLSLNSFQNTPTLSLYSHPNPNKPKSFFPLSHSLISKTQKPTRPKFTVCAVKRLSEVELSPVSGEFAAESGVYAVYDESGDLQFIGISRNVGASVNTHKKAVPELCGSVKVGLVDDPDRTALTQAWKSWMEEHIAATGKVPPGNESGNTTWVRPPPLQKKKKPDLRLTPGRHVSLTVPLEQLIDQLVKENKVVAFIKGSRGAPQCGFSQRVVGILENEGVDYESVDVLDEEYNNGLRETLKKYSSWPTFPQVFVNGELLGGCDILSSMYEKGELGALLKK